MATLTYDPTPADEPEFNAGEQEAIAIGEAQAEAEQQMLAGKFKDAEALEQAYIELQKKLGTNDENGSDEPEQEVRDEEDTTEEEVEENPIYELLNKASDEFYANDGEISEEVLGQLEDLDSSELIAAYIGMQGETEPTADFNDSEVASIHQIAGGEEAYGNLTNWADQNMPREYVDAFNNLVEEGNLEMVQLAVAGLQSQFVQANGYEGEMLTGKAAQPQVDTFRSQAEVVAAMHDPRYDNDPAYRQDVFQKLERSNLAY
tara:strand:+ start:4042 stop:4824 length:783 start_codon:yes stop_codon:yes gene_type:complete